MAEHGAAMSENHIFREAWLTRLVDTMREELFAPHGYTVPEATRISVGWPRGSRKAIGQCWPAPASADGHHEIFISPALSDAMEVSATVAHELAHASLPDEVGHNGPFVKCVRAIGLDGKPTATRAGDAFKAWAIPVLEKLGPYPHGRLSAMDGPGRKKQSTRMLKLHCLACADARAPYIARMSAQTIKRGTPICPIHHIPMEPDNG